jgi:hypothetical protein
MIPVLRADAGQTQKLDQRNRANAARMLQNMGGFGSPHMPQKSEMAIWAAVITALDNCQESDAPLATLGEFIGQLQDKGWARDDVREVERCVLELMRWRKEQKTCPPRMQSGRPESPQFENSQGGAHFRADR